MDKEGGAKTDRDAHALASHADSSGEKFPNLTTLIAQPSLEAPVPVGCRLWHLGLLGLKRGSRDFPIGNISNRECYGKNAPGAWAGGGGGPPRLDFACNTETQVRKEGAGVRAKPKERERAPPAKAVRLR